MPVSLKQTAHKHLAGPALPLIAFCIALNLTIGQLTALLKIPVYLDSIGTVLVAVLCGGLAALVTGVLSNIMAAAFGNPTMMFFIPAVLVIALGASGFARLGAFRTWVTCGLSGVLLGVAAAAVSAPISAYLFSGTTLAGTDALVLFFRSTGSTILRSTFYQGLTSDPLDKLITFLAVYSITHTLPRRILARFPSGQNVMHVSEWR